MHRADKPYHLHVPIVLKSGSLNLLKPSGPLQACNGIALPLLRYGHRKGKIKEQELEKSSYLKKRLGRESTLENLIRNKDISRKLKVLNWNYRITNKRNNCVDLVRRNGN